MHLLVTAGNTQAPIDRVRCITNIFTGRTGTSIALQANLRGHAVTLLTSHPELITEPAPKSGWTMHPYKTFDDLRRLMSALIPRGQFDAIVHCAAVSDYLAAGIYAADREATIDHRGKLKSDSPEVWLRMIRAPKLVDAIRAEWGFQGILVKFKLEVGVDDQGLLAIAEESRHQSNANLLVANTLDDMKHWAFLGPINGKYERIARPELTDRLLDSITAIHEAD
jgi:phosphopantothenate-cysteine ligase/phosphopantothenoylcysteine decarboxylase/phosphopantothenate--cysteine ligase